MWRRVNNFIQTVSESTDLQPYVVHETWKAIRDTENCTEKQPLTQVSCWCIGEYGSALLNGVSVENETIVVTEDEVIEIYMKILWAKHMSLVTKQYALMSIAKLSTRFSNATPKIQDTIDAFHVHMEIDLQQRGVEFSQLFTKVDRNIRDSVLEPMAPMQRDVLGRNTAESNGDILNDAQESLIGNDLNSLSLIGSSTNSNVGGDISLLDLIDTTSNSLPITSTNPPVNLNSSNGQDSLLDLLGDLDLGGNSVKPPPPEAVVPSPLSNLTQPSNLLDGLTSPISTLPQQNNNLDDIFNNIPSIVNNTNGSTIPNMIGYNQNDISITFQFDRPSPEGLVIMNLKIVNLSTTSVSEFVLQAAVPKRGDMKLEMMAASSTEIPANGGSIQLTMKVNNPNRIALKMRLKISFNRGGQPIMDQADVSNFPPALTSG